MSRRPLLPTLGFATLFYSLAAGAVAVAEPPLDPASFLGHRLGERFTPPHRITEYLEHLSATSDRVRLEEIGRSVEDRPLHLLTITSPAHHRDLEGLRRAHLEAKPEEPPSPLVVWLGFGVHGNEASSPEAAMAVAWELATGPAEQLEDLVVLLDPLSNPDGRSRYVEAFRTRRGSEPAPHPLAAEHREPWPGGRTNHYLFDLNRDWAWLSQVESRARIAAFRRWEPHVVVDFHEMSSESEYYFPPAADPVHPGIASQVLSWQEIFGRANAAAFDARGWSYFVREKYDLFYPGYGDSYSSLRGAVGMTYEVAGGGRAGIVREGGGSLSLAQRIDRHTTSARATIATGVRERERLVRSLRELRSSSPHSGWLLWDAAQGEAASLAVLLRDQGAEVRTLSTPVELAVTRLGEQQTSPRTFSAGAFAIDLAQPLASLVLGILDPDVEVPEEFLAAQRRRVDARREPEFYDVTAWALPLAWNLEIHRSRKAPGSHEPFVEVPGRVVGSGLLGAIFPSPGLSSWQAVATLLGAGARISRTLHPLDLEGRTWPAGSFWVRFPDPATEAIAQLERAVGRFGVHAVRVGSTFPATGRAPGSADVVPLARPRIGLLAGPGIDPTSFGSLWHFLDRHLALLPLRLDPDVLDEPELADLDVLILPDGSGWEEILGPDRRAALDRWVRNGGTAITIARALEPLQEAAISGFVTWEPEDEVATPRRSGAIVSTRLGALAPIGVGLPRPPPAMVRNEPLLRPTGDPRRDLLTVATDDPVLAGVVWPQTLPGLEGALLVGSEPLGRGRLVVFAIEPAFRGFWRATMPLLAEAILVLPSLELETD